MSSIHIPAHSSLEPLKCYRGVLPALEKGENRPREQEPAWPSYEKGEDPSLQRFTRYPGSQDSIRPLALPTMERGSSPLKGCELMMES